MKEISYAGEAFQKEESAWLKNHKRIVPPATPTTPPVHAIDTELKESTPTTSDTKTENAPSEPEPNTSAAPHTPDTEDEDHHLGFIIFVLTLVLAFGLGVGVYVLIGTEKAPTLPLPPILPVEEVTTHTIQHTDILLHDSPRAQILVDVALAFKKTPVAEGGVHHVTFLTQDMNGNTRAATAHELLQSINARAPEALLHSLEEKLTYEIYQGSPNTGKLLLISRSAAHTFGALYDWEDALAQTLTQLIHPTISLSSLSELKGRKFHDERIGTVDARVLVDAMDSVVLIYGFIDSRTLVIAGSRKVFMQPEVLP